MSRSKKFLITGVLVVIVLAATLGGVAAAQANDENTTTSLVEDIQNTLLNKVAEIYQANTGTALDVPEMEKAFEQAREEIRTDNRDSFLQRLVENGTITQEQADQWQAWLDARPAFPTEEFKQWLESRPDIPGLFGQANRGGMRFFGVMHNGKGMFNIKMGGCWEE